MGYYNQFMIIKPMGHIVSPYLTKFGVPRQPGLADAIESRIVFDDDAEPASIARVCGPGDWLLVLWAFSHNVEPGRPWSKTVRPPRLGGNERMGVFATRSSFRPNDLALSIVRITKLDALSISFSGGDMVDGTPVYGVEPYDHRRHARPDALPGWPGDAEWPLLERVEIPEHVRAGFAHAELRGLEQILVQDPRPAYTREGQEDRVFWTILYEREVAFTVREGVLRVVSARKLTDVELETVRRFGSLGEGQDTRQSD